MICGRLFHSANDKLSLLEKRVSELDAEVERYAQELQFQQIEANGYKLDISEWRKLKGLLDGNCEELEEAQGNSLAARVEGFRYVFTRIKNNNEYVQLLVNVNSACLTVGYQNGLCAGYMYSERGLLLEERPCHDPSAEQRMTDAILALGAMNHSLLACLGGSPDMSVSDIDALTAVVDPTTPRP
ncbi:hypothetical protein R6Q59_035785 [Mikania micrantha]